MCAEELVLPFTKDIFQISGMFMFLKHCNSFGVIYSPVNISDKSAVKVGKLLGSSA